jgi:hypothetical protein
MPFSLRDKGTIGAEQEGWDEGMFVSDFARLHRRTEKRVSRREIAECESSRLEGGNSYALRSIHLRRLFP